MEIFRIPHKAFMRSIDHSEAVRQRMRDPDSDEDDACE
jgi:hypothetical protein